MSKAERRQVVEFDDDEELLREVAEKFADSPPGKIAQRILDQSEENTS